MTVQRQAKLQQHSIVDYRSRQRGVGMIGLSAILCLAIFFGLVGFKVGPAYAEYWTISRVADEIAQKPEVLKGPKSSVYTSLQKAFTHNNLWDAKPKERIRVEKDGSLGHTLHVDYEARSNLFGNIYIVTKFEKQAGAAGL
jgi:hypothetical protein